MFKNLKIGVRLGIGFASTLAFLVIVAVVSFQRLGALVSLATRCEENALLQNRAVAPAALGNPSN